MVPTHIQIHKVCTYQRGTGQTRWTWTLMYRTRLELSRPNRDHPTPKAAIQAAHRALENANTCEWGPLARKIPVRFRKS